MILETIDTSGASLGSYSYGFTVTVPSSVVPTISSISASPVNDNSVISGWGIYVYGKSKAKLTINGAAGAYGSTIRSYSITTSPNVGSASSASYTTGLLYSSGVITVTAKVTDSRGRTATKPRRSASMPIPRHISAALRAIAATAAARAMTSTGHTPAYSPLLAVPPSTAATMFPAVWS